MAWSDEYGCLVSNRALACGPCVDLSGDTDRIAARKQAQTHIRPVAALSDSSLQHYTQGEHLQL